MKTIKELLEVYKPKSPDEQKFVDKHVTIKHKDRNGNGDDVFKADNIKTIKRKEERHGYDVNDDEKVYEEVEEIDELSQKMVRAYRDKARDDKESAEDDREYYKAHDDNTDDEDKKIRKRTAGIKMAGKKIYGGAKVPVKEESEVDALLDEALELLMSIDEKTLTPAEMKKREEVVKAIKRGNPKMDKSMAYAIATKTAKRVAEGVIPTADEPTEHDKKMAQKVRDLLAKEKKPVKEEAEELDELSTKTLEKYRNVARADAYDANDVDDEPRFRKRAKGITRANKAIGKNFVKGVDEEVEDLDESAKVAAHLIKRYGDNVRKSHVRSAANDFGVGYVALAHAVRKKLGVNRLEEEQIDEISAAKLTDYTAKASDARGHRDMPTSKLDKRYKSMALAHEKIRGRHAKVPANEETEQIDELSNKTLSSYAKKATNQAFSKGVAGGAALASSDKETEAQGHKLVNKAAKRMAGAQKAIGKLTKEDIINRTIEKYVPEDYTPPSLDEQFLSKIDHLSESHAITLLSLFDSLNEENKVTMIDTVETEDGINSLLDFAIQNRGA